MGAETYNDGGYGANAALDPRFAIAYKGEVSRLSQGSKQVKKRYQVFVSSTFVDLQDERQEVMQALLELNCIPAGMELFPAANEDQWSLIKKVIQDSDYYLVVLAGRYGSIGPEGYSYTEMEYRYALELGKPVIGFVHQEPGNIPSKWTEATAEGKEKLTSFQDLVQKKICKFWTSPSDLGGKVSRSLVRLMSECPAVGWVRGDQVPDESAAQEILTLRRRIEELQQEKTTARTTQPEGADALAKGSEEFKVHYSFTSMDKNYARAKYNSWEMMSWDLLFSAISPLLMNEANEVQMSNALDSCVEQVAREGLREDSDFSGTTLTNFQVGDDDFHTIKIQFKALGYIQQSDRKRGIKDFGTYWTLTPYGDTVMTRLRAVKSGQFE